MQLVGSKISAIKQEVIKALVESKLVEIEPENTEEVGLDIEAVLKEYLRRDRLLTDKAKDEAQKRGLEFGAHHKIKRTLAEKERFPLYDESLGYICNQLIETLLHTQHVEEVYGEDHELRAVIAPVLKHHMSAGDGVDLEVRKRIKNLQEGTQDWEIRYQQEMARVRAARKLEK